jgi:isochorismate hydrolase
MNLAIHSCSHEDAMSCGSAEHHEASVNFIFPRLGLVRQSEDVIQALAD